MLLIFGFGYTGRAIARAALAAGIPVCAVSRTPERVAPEPGVRPGLRLVAFDEAEAEIAGAGQIIATAAPAEAADGAEDPVLARFAPAIAAARSLRWLGYLSSTGVYGDRAGAWVDEETLPAPRSPRAARRLRAEAAFAAYGTRLAVDVFRLAGIYGPARSVLDDLRQGTARRVIKPGHVFSRIHRDDIAAGVLAAMRQNPPPGLRIFNFADDLPAPSAEVVAEGARLLGMTPPMPVRFADAAAAMSPMALSFWAENRRVSNSRTLATLGLAWRYPTYREGLRAILAEEAAQRAGQQ